MNKETQENTGCAPGPGCVCVMSLILSAMLISGGIDFRDDSLIIIGSLIPIFLGNFLYSISKKSST